MLNRKISVSDVVQRIKLQFQLCAQIKLALKCEPLTVNEKKNMSFDKIVNALRIIFNQTM